MPIDNVACNFSLTKAESYRCWYAGNENRKVRKLIIALAALRRDTCQCHSPRVRSKSLPPGQLAQIAKNGQTYYVFPDAANNRAFVGGPDQYQALVNYRLSQHLAAEQLATSTAYTDPSLGWDTWNGWPGTYGHQRRATRRAVRRSYYGY
jgi:hypothetical protein